MAMIKSVAVFFLIFFLVSCGRKGDPIPPDPMGEVNRIFDFKARFW